MDLRGHKLIRDLHFEVITLSCNAIKALISSGYVSTGVHSNVISYNAYEQFRDSQSMNSMSYEEI